MTDDWWTEGEEDGERLQKVISSAGHGSRRVCDDLIAEGRVTVNGRVAKPGRRVDPDNDRIEIDGAPVASKAGLVHYLLNKPAGVVSTSSDPEGRETVVDLVPAEPRVYSVGRLDFETEGLLILTNDGDLAHRLTHPAFGVDKEYLAHVQGAPSGKSLAKLRNGIELDDGMTAPAKVGVLSQGLLRITIHEGRNRQVRRMCEAIGHPVLRLARSRIGPIDDPNLAPGSWRPLNVDEVRKLAAATVARPGKAPLRRSR